MTKQRVRIGLVVEGDTERLLFEAKRDWFRQQGFDIKVAQAGGRPRLLQEARQHLEVMRLKGCQHVFFLFDQETDACPPAAAALLGAALAEADVTACVMASQIEAWLLADDLGVERVTGQKAPGPPTDELSEPAQRLKELFRRTPQRRSLTKTEIARRLAPQFDLARAAQGNRSAQRLMRKLAEVAELP